MKADACPAEGARILLAHSPTIAFHQTDISRNCTGNKPGWAWRGGTPLMTTDPARQHGVQQNQRDIAPSDSPTTCVRPFVARAWTSIAI